MGMKKNMLGLLIAMSSIRAMEHDPYEITGRGRIASDNVSEPRYKEPTPFKERDGIVRLIKDYILIKSGQSKKGKTKQNRIVSKVDAMIEKGYLTQTDLN